MKQRLNIKGSAKVVSEFFVYAVNSILWQRCVYPGKATLFLKSFLWRRTPLDHADAPPLCCTEDTFERKNEYGTVLQVTKDAKLKDYLANVLGQVEAWAAEGKLQQLVMVIAKIDTQEPLERWVFNVETDKKAAAGGEEREKPREQLRGEIGAIMRQITSSVSYLPLLEERCSFDLLVYTDKQAEVPITWENSDARMIANSQQVKVKRAVNACTRIVYSQMFALQLRGFDTNIHRVDASVAYRIE